MVRVTLKKVLSSIMNVYTETEYIWLHLTASKPSAFYGNTKAHKRKKGKKLKELTLRPIVSNVGIATFNIAKYLANLLAPVFAPRFARGRVYKIIYEIIDWIGVFFKKLNQML